MVVEVEIAKLRKFQEFLRTDDKLVFQDLLNQCKLYAPYASTMVSTIKEVPLSLLKNPPKSWKPRQFRRTKSLARFVPFSYVRSTSQELLPF